jgi:predicted CXXCH cytochrome family protein
VGCHTTIAKERPEVLKLMGYWDRSEPIPWERVHDLPDFVRFNHKRHVLAEVECRECHGDVQSMEAAQQVNSLEMGFCLECHRRRGASTDCLTCHH